ncbi:hypothetical protein Q9966_012096 [Columba livia]|nr:hypothetical protein Q9966_012096 [Columba livia]
MVFGLGFFNSSWSFVEDVSGSNTLQPGSGQLQRVVHEHYGLRVELLGAKRILYLELSLLYHPDFSEIRQMQFAWLLDLFIQWDWSTYLADYGQPTCKYLRVNPTTALVLLEKMRDTSRKNNVFAQFRKNERDKQKLIDTVAKQLRGLINSHHS